MGGSGGLGGAGGVGGSGSVSDCGNGVVEPGEECDDGNDDDGDGCDHACVVECPPPRHKHPSTHHCYWHRTTPHSWDDARQWCTSRGLGWDLAAITSESERDWVDQVVDPQGDYWIGANDIVTDTVWQWSNGEPWGYDAWGNDEPDNGDGEDCCQSRPLDPGADLWADSGCTDAMRFLCEMTPAGL